MKSNTLQLSTQFAKGVSAPSERQLWGAPTPAVAFQQRFEAREIAVPQAFMLAAEGPVVICVFVQNSEVMHKRRGAEIVREVLCGCYVQIERQIMAWKITVQATRKVAGKPQDMFLMVDGLKIARRGYPDTPEAGAWVPIEPGWEVKDVQGGEEIWVRYTDPLDGKVTTFPEVGRQ